jgi:hypothetical protein
MDWVINKVRTFFCGRKRGRSSTDDDKIEEHNRLMYLRKRTLESHRYSYSSKNLHSFFNKTNINNPNKIQSNNMGIIMNLCKRHSQKEIKTSAILKLDNLSLDDEKENNLLNENIVDLSDKKSDKLRLIRKDYRRFNENILSKNDAINFPIITEEQFVKLQRYNFYNYIVYLMILSHSIHPSISVS